MVVLGGAQGFSASISFTNSANGICKSLKNKLGTVPALLGMLDLELHLPQPGTTMKLKSTLKVIGATAALTFAAAASAAVYCPGNTSYTPLSTGGYINTTTTAVPNTGGVVATPSGWNSYIYSDNFKNTRECYWVDSNLDSAGKPTYKNGWEEFADNSSQFSLAGIVVYKDVVKDGVFNATIFDWTYDASTGIGTWDITGYDIINHPLYIGFHFGNGQDDPDSFIIQLTELTGTFTFSALSNQGERVASGLSNLYLFGTREVPCTDPKDPNCGGEAPEPGSLALLGAGLASLALIRRRRPAK